MGTSRHRARRGRCIEGRGGGSPGYMRGGATKAKPLLAIPGHACTPLAHNSENGSKRNRITRALILTTISRVWTTTVVDLAVVDVSPAEQHCLQFFDDFLPCVSGTWIPALETSKFDPNQFGIESYKAGYSPGEQEVVLGLLFMLGATVAPNLNTFRDNHEMLGGVLFVRDSTSTPSGSRSLRFNRLSRSAPQITFEAVLMFLNGLYAVTEMYPFHLQARKLNIWTVGYIVSPFLLPFVFGFLVARTTCRWVYGIGTIYSAIKYQHANIFAVVEMWQFDGKVEYSLGFCGFGCSHSPIPPSSLGSAAWRRSLSAAAINVKVPRKRRRGVFLGTSLHAKWQEDTIAPHIPSAPHCPTAILPWITFDAPPRLPASLHVLTAPSAGHDRATHRPPPNCIAKHAQPAIHIGSSTPTRTRPPPYSSTIAPTPRPQAVLPVPHAAPPACAECRGGVLSAASSPPRVALVAVLAPHWPAAS
ncbi:hypothetical protein B0H14DRAFT_2641258 [Mycena olivaceomarginata]|nr:hypothetical protein B0H14DRAFT_2641258 [Mycena olivaceomarginata]